MANPTSITAGQTGKFVAQLNLNGSPINLPAGSTWTWTTSDPAATQLVDPSDATGGTLDVTIPLTDASTSVTITATANIPSGAVSGNDVSTIVPAPMVFTVSVTQVQ
jgi:hypothetical protein